MKRKLYDFQPQPLHVVGKCQGETWPAPMATLWWLFGDLLDEFGRYYSLETQAFVMMSNHYHWLCSYPGTIKERSQLISSFHEKLEFYLKSPIRMGLKKEAVKLAPLWEGKANVTPIDHVVAYRETYAYVYRNPVYAGLVESAEKYPFSTLSYMLGQRTEPLKFRCVDHMNLMTHPQMVLDFINLKSSYSTAVIR